jgi:hypothetical protein
MKHISELLGIGEGKKCLIVGGGPSLNTFEWDKLEDTYIICINDHFPQLADMIVYYDKDMRDYFKEYTIPDRTLLMGFRKNKDDVCSIDHTCERCDYYYTYMDMEYGDSGYHTLQFADHILNFSEIYLIGLDYTTDGRSYHYNETESDPEKLEKFQKWSIEIVLKKYFNMDWTNDIYNCSRNSALDIFEYKLPWKS